tara:strand:+ start:53 stop:223 length:171 start_codon:yes stop_codon:yes gene_type:complete
MIRVFGDEDFKMFYISNELGDVEIVSEFPYYKGMSNKEKQIWGINTNKIIENCQSK